MLKQDADVTTPLEVDTEDAVIPKLLEAGLTAWILEGRAPIVAKPSAWTRRPAPSPLYTQDCVSH
jgi:hypothetical protein